MTKINARTTLDDILSTMILTDEVAAMRHAYQKTMDHTVQVTNEWIHQIDETMPWDDSNKSFRLLRATLHAIRDMLSVDEAAQFSAQLPLFLRGLYFEGWDPTHSTNKVREKDGFIDRVSEEFAPDTLDNPEAAIGTLLSVINTRVSAGEIEDIRASVRKSLKDLWPETAH